jgi:hypothetical protein
MDGSASAFMQLDGVKKRGKIPSTGEDPWRQQSRGSVAVLGHDKQHSMPAEEVKGVSNGQVLYGVEGQREKTLRPEPCRRTLLHADGGRVRSVDSLGLGEGLRAMFGEGRRGMA